MFDDLEYRRSETARHRENSARLAQEYHKFWSTGSGFMEFEDAAEFDITFIEEPYMHYGCQVDIDELADALNVEPGDTPPLPTCTGFVTDWDLDDRGFYLGAFLAVSVTWPTVSTVTIPPDLTVRIKHHFTFTAVGIKDVPIDIRT